MPTTLLSNNYSNLEKNLSSSSGPEGLSNTGRDFSFGPGIEGAMLRLPWNRGMKYLGFVIGCELIVGALMVPVGPGIPELLECLRVTVTGTGSCRVWMSALDLPLLAVCPAAGNGYIGGTLNPLATFTDLVFGSLD